MKKLTDMTFGFVGLGLMGGSIAKAIKQKVLSSGTEVFKIGEGLDGLSHDQVNAKIFAMDMNLDSLKNAKEENIIDEWFAPQQTDEMLEKCDFVFICLYPKATVRFLAEHKNAFKSDSIVTDISGVKTLIAQKVFESSSSPVRDDVDFILGHPMAGNEKEGYGASCGTVFEGRNYILMPHKSNREENLALMRELITKLGIKRIIETDYKTHDHKIAFTSQLCHVIASSLVDSAEDDKITAFGGGSYEDLTRIALINAPLWTELFLLNKEELVSMINSFENSLSKIKNAIESENASELNSILKAVREKRAAMAKV
ncbi:MAG: prephenate dehydrogenase [Treponema sp.]|uniref:prephenate dehydrogenase n=1 Tax=Treponema sp. TaxID=166 RepID=UPI00298DD718|nr:prephenate dehydrogenase [Treponema sp.]MBR5934195.1 prephenate dehydrogenase [Treponema sp.]